MVCNERGWVTTMPYQIGVLAIVSKYDDDDDDEVL